VDYWSIMMTAEELERMDFKDFTIRDKNLDGVLKNVLI
jgi:hypothetical protein